MSNKTASEDNLFVCCACGKTSTTRYGFDESNRSTASPGWDESCMMNAQEFPKDSLVWNEGRTRVVKVDAPEVFP